MEKKIHPNDWNNLATAYLKRNNYKKNVPWTDEMTHMISTDIT